MKTVRMPVLYVFLLSWVISFSSCNKNSSKNTINNNLNNNNANNINTNNTHHDSPHLARIDIVPSSVSLQPGQTTQLTAVGVYDDDSTRDLTNEAMWVSEDESVATVDHTGHVNALAPGVIQVSAVLERITGTARIEVLPELADPTHEREFRAVCFMRTVHTLMLYFLIFAYFSNEIVQF